MDTNKASISVDLIPDLEERTLILACPSAAAHEEYIGRLFEIYPRSRTDLQMIDRLAGGLVTIPESAYNLVMLLVGPNGCWRQETSAFLSRNILSSLAAALKPRGVLRNEDSSPLGSAVAKEAVLSGLIDGPDGSFKKPEYEEAAVPLRLGFKNKTNGFSVQKGVIGLHDANGGAHNSAGPAVQTLTVDVNGKTETLNMAPTAAKATPAGVGYDDLLEEDEDNELIDEDTLLHDDEMFKPIQQPPECKPRGKRRACADCTCGLAARLQAQDKARQAEADKGLKTLKLKSEDLTELDFTVQGKTGSCGSCSLGDAFRCADCPYIGLPPFKPGEEVKILNNVAQL